MAGAIQQASEFFHASGWVAWPLSALSVVSLALCLERAIYFAALRKSLKPERVRLVSQALRTNNETILARESGSGLLGRFVSALLDGSTQGPVGESTILAAAESVRPSLERYLSFLSTAITAAPMLGILGTVTGIIKSFGLLGSAERVTDTAFGLVIALVVLFPYNHFRKATDRALGVLETVGAAAVEGSTRRAS